MRDNALRGFDDVSTRIMKEMHPENVRMSSHLETVTTYVIPKGRLMRQLE